MAEPRMQSLNENFQLIVESSIKMNRLGEVKYPTSKIKRIEKAVKTRIPNFPDIVISTNFFSGFIKPYNSGSQPFLLHPLIPQQSPTLPKSNLFS